MEGGDTNPAGSRRRWAIAAGIALAVSVLAVGALGAVLLTRPPGGSRGVVGTGPSASAVVETPSADATLCSAPNCAPPPSPCPAARCASPDPIRATPTAAACGSTTRPCSPAPCASTPCPSPTACASGCPGVPQCTTADAAVAVWTDAPTYSRGTAVRIASNVTNRSPHPCTITADYSNFSCSPAGEIDAPNGQPVWYSRNPAIMAPCRVGDTYLLSPGLSAPTVSWTWNQMVACASPPCPNSSEPAAAGTYTAKAKWSVGQASTTFTIS